MPSLLVVHHSSTPSVSTLTDAVVAGASDDAIEGVEVVVRPALEATAADVLARLHAQSVRHQFKLSSRPQRAKVSVLEHVAIIDAIVARDPDASERAVRDHLLAVIGALRDLP